MLLRFRRIGEKVAGDWSGLKRAIDLFPDCIVEVRKYDKQREISKQQMAYLHAVVFPALAEYMGVSELMAELILKKKCGEQWFVKTLNREKFIISKTELSTKQTTVWMENIWDFMEAIGCPVPPPDKDWKSVLE